MRLRSILMAGLLLISLLTGPQVTHADTGSRPHSANPNGQPTLIPDPNSLGVWNRLGDFSSFVYQNGTLLFLPTLVVADVPVCNLPGLRKPLRFTPQILAGIFLGAITKWNDPAIREVNPGIRLPNQGIIVIRRKDETGETLMWTDYLSKVSDEWSHRVGKRAVVQWPLGIGVTGSHGVERKVKSTEYSVSYMERLLAIQKKIQFGELQNSAGRFVLADVRSVTAAAERTGNIDFKSSVSITNSLGDDAYPIVGFSGFIIPDQISNVQEKHTIISFVRWVLTDGQNTAVADGYVPVPAKIIRQELQLLDALNR